MAPLKRQVAAPPTGADLSRAQWQAKTDEYELALQEAQGAGLTIAGELARCRGTPNPTS